MSSNSVYLFYRQALNWPEGKIQRHILARESDSKAILSLSLALLHLRLPFYGKATAALEDPVTISDLIQRICSACTDSERVQTVSILSEIANAYIEEGMKTDYLHIHLLTQTVAIISLQIENRNLKFVDCIHSLEKLLDKPITIEEIEKLANQGREKSKNKLRESEKPISDPNAKYFKRRFKDGQTISCKIMSRQSAGFQVLIESEKVVGFFISDSNYRIGEIVNLTFVKWAGNEVVLTES